jgi:threonylcarbamoyladenosine tRNA methylthiotransferase MtaB
LEALSPISGLERVRLSSIEPTDVKLDLIHAMKELPNVCPQLHIPLQSGDDEILKRMNRRYRRDFYQTLIHDLRAALPDFCLSMDVMAGFPGEEESHFQNTLSLLEITRPIRVHAFPYSRRDGTRAAHFEDLPPSVIRERMNRLAVFAHEVTHREREKFLGRSFPVLVEKKSSQGGLYQGHTAHYLKVYFQASPEFLGQSISVRLAASREDGLLGQFEGASLD